MPRYLGLGWIAAYAVGLLMWLAIYELWGAVVVVVLLVIGTAAIVAGAHLLGDGHVERTEDPPCR